MNTRRLFLLALAALSACAPTSTNAGQSAFELAGSEWGMEMGLDTQFIQFQADGKVVGNGGCNQFSGSYQQSGNQLSVGPLMSTKRACLDLEKETAFFSALDRTRSFAGDHMKLTLKSESGDVILILVRRDWD